MILIISFPVSLHVSPDSHTGNSVSPAGGGLGAESLCCCSNHPCVDYSSGVV